ncbi:hypothetical protein AC579_7796 [Pseudocercospora musae]|uniref:Uncharacterized protein n=1 Tax=Pseudocercospora musae TaxID=113226 RepID=A0A139IJ55_9PEZI|nr:hypothetical protein AC579_7796 [Pseudocercospora musae]
MNDTTRANSPVIHYDFKIEWLLAKRLPKVNRPWSEMNKITLDQNTTTRQLRLNIKDQIQRYFEGCEDFGGADIKRFMGKITENYNEGKARSDRVDSATFWIVRFSVTIITGQRIFELDSGLWQRVVKLSDIVGPTDHLKLHVKVNFQECTSKARKGRFRKDTDLAHHVYPLLQELSYYKVGTVQNAEARRKDVDLVEADNKASLLSGRMSSSPDMRKWMKANCAYKSVTLKEESGNPSMTVLKIRIANEKHLNRFNGKDQELRQKEVPVLPPLTLMPFSRALLNDASNKLRDGIEFRVIVRIVYLLPDVELNESELRRPQSACITVNNGHTFWNLEETVFDRSMWYQEENQIDTTVCEADYKCVWWIMDPSKKGDIGKMYWVDDVDRPVCKYIPDAADEDGERIVSCTLSATFDQRQRQTSTRKQACRGAEERQAVLD